MLKSFRVNVQVLNWVALAGILLVGCGEIPEGETPEPAPDDEYYEFQQFILSDYELPAVIALPDETAKIGASVKPEVIHNESFKWEINVGPNFCMHIEDFGNDKGLVKGKKKKLGEQDIFKLKYMVDEENLIVYERILDVKGSSDAASSVGVEHKSYHVYAERQIAGVTYILESRQEGFEKRIINLMTKSIRSFREVEE